MRLFIASLALASAALAGAANAQADRLSDSEFVALARCAGLYQGAGRDAETLNHQLRAERRGRADHIRERATNARSEAASEARSGADAERLAAERAACTA